MSLRSNIWIGLLATLSSLAGASQPAEEQAEKVECIRWSSDQPLIGTNTERTEQGVKVTVDSQVIPVLVPWYDVRELEKPDDGFGAFAQIAQDAWRAHSRFERGDYPGAQRIYTRLADDYLWKVGRQSADVSYGLMRCSLDQQDFRRATIPMLSWLVATGPTRASRESDLPTDFDSKHNLFITLPPISHPGTESYGLGPLRVDAVTDRQAALHELYDLSFSIGFVRDEQSSERLLALSERISKQRLRDPGIMLILDMLIARGHPVADKRADARGKLERRVQYDDDTWIEVWSRLGLGMSLLSERDHASKDRGVIHLIHIVVRLRDISPTLAQLAAKIADDHLAKTDRSRWGDELINESKKHGSITESKLVLPSQGTHQP